MPLKPPDAAQLWREVEEHLAPTFSLWSSDRVVIFYLLRASRLAGRRVILMPARTLARATLLSRSTIRTALRRLGARDIIRVLKRDYSGLQIEVKLPSEIPGCISDSRMPDGRSLDTLDFWSSRVRRSAIYRRDGHRCFYCLRRLRTEARVIDHVIPRATAGSAHLRALRASA
ncbi:MAG: HNH endonuclease, partial [Candidatus Acidiferrales bacterium]